MSASNTEASRASFDAWWQSPPDDDCWVLTPLQIWQASRKAALNEAIARVQQCLGPRSSAETAIKELLK